MTGWLIALAVIALIWFLPLGVSAIYNTHGLFVRLVVGPLKVTVFPGKKREKATKERSAAEGKTGKRKKEQTSKTGGSYRDFLPLVNLVLDFLKDFRRKLRISLLELKLIMGDSDPCDLAVNYGRAWAALGNLLPLLEQAFVIKKRDLEVEYDFTSTTTLIFARADLTLTVGRILSMGLWHGVHILKEYIHIINQRKGGVKQ